jgi:hypothetical protein
VRKLSWFVGAIVMTTAGLYTAVSLARWEWSRALFFGLVFIAAELTVVAGALFAKLSTIERRIESVEAASSARSGPDPHILDALRSGRDEHDRFPWLEVDPRDVVTRTNVFITLVVGGGVLLTAGTWVIDKVASRTVDPGREAKLGQDLDAIAYRGGLVVDDMEARARSRPDQEDDRLTSFLHPRR